MLHVHVCLYGHLWNMYYVITFLLWFYVQVWNTLYLIIYFVWATWTLRTSTLFTCVWLIIDFIWIPHLCLEYVLYTLYLGLKYVLSNNTFYMNSTLVSGIRLVIKLYIWVWNTSYQIIDLICIPGIHLVISILEFEIHFIWISHFSLEYVL